MNKQFLLKNILILLKFLIKKIKYKFKIIFLKKSA
jgi:hypothetical protein